MSKLGKMFPLILGPLLFAIIIAIEPSSSVARVLGLCSWMLVWWISEIVPIPVTALLPLLLFPLLEIFSIREAAQSYANPIIYLFLGGFLMALAVEKHGLHKRIALNLINFLGTTPRQLLLGFMLSTAILSMWISNTATTVMMLPVAVSVLAILRDSEKFDQKNKSNARKSGGIATVLHDRFAICLLLGIAYSANIGGFATIIGTPTNLVLIGYLQENLGLQIAFLQWSAFALPISLLIFFMSYLLLLRTLRGNGNDTATIKKTGAPQKKRQGIEEYLQQEMRQLGKMSGAERSVLLIFAITVAGWILKIKINDTFSSNLTDTSIAMIGSILMFVTPIRGKKIQFLLEWQDTKRLAWGILLLFGGGLCIAKALSETGIIQQITNQFPGGIPLIVLMLLTTGVALLLTELMSNVALISIYLPILVALSTSLGLGPLVLTVAATIAGSCAFMLPIATPPNAIVFSSGLIQMREMIRWGFLVNIISLIIIILACYFLFVWQAIL